MNTPDKQNLDRRVAEALGLNVAYVTGKLQFMDHANACGEFSPSANWEQCGKLIEEYGITIFPSRDGESWSAQFDHWSAGSPTVHGATPMTAVCKALIEALKDD